MFGVRPDLWCFGKVIGGGLPLAAFGGRRDVMETLAPVGPVYQAGTLSGNPLATAAGLAVLSLLHDDDYDALATTARTLAHGLVDVFTDAGLSVQVPVKGPLLSVFFNDAPVVDYDGAKAAAASGTYARLFAALLDQGVAFAPSPYEVLFPSLAHTDDDIARTIDVVAAAARALRV
jgi:glutamate-1-semialdehyde 2,1-aminomutase